MHVAKRSLRGIVFIGFRSIAPGRPLMRYVALAYFGG
jgi:hypothetical protein